MSATQAKPAHAAGLFTTLRAGLNAGLAAGAVLGLADGAVAGARVGTTGLVDWLGCLGAAVVVYGVVWVCALLALSLVLHPLVRARPLAVRLRVLLALGLGAGIFLDLYWWSRPFLYYGVPAVDPRRLAVAAVLLALGLALGWLAVWLGARAPRSALWAGAALVPIAWIGGVSYLAAERGDVGRLGEIGDRNRELPNVLLFVVDALRADALGCYGNERVETPAIDALAANGVLFERAMVQAPFTWSSFGSLLTGKYPRRHGLVKMEAGTRMAPNVTLASHLKSATKLDLSGALEHGDYHGATFMTGTLSHGSGLMRGFDTYFEAMVGHDVVDVESEWSRFRSELILSIARTKLAQRFDRSPTATVARRWFAENGRKRFVAMAHFYSTHTPYDPPQRFRDEYCDPSYDGPIRVFHAEARIAIEQGGYELSDADSAQIRNLYYGGVAHADEMIGSVLGELERQGVLGDTLVIVTADHGEELGDHGLWEHNHMFQTNLRVPLVMSWPGRLPAGRRVGALVEQVDVLPTVCDLLGLQAPHEPGRVDDLGRDYGAIDGVSLRPLIEGRAERVKELSFAENGPEAAVQDLEWKLIVPASALAEGRVDAASALGRPRLFHLAKDPGETREVSGENPEVVARLFAALREWDARMPIPRSEIVLSDRDREQMARRLRELGYTDGVGLGVPPKKPE